MFTIAEVITLLTRIFVRQAKRFPKGLEGVDIRLKAKKIYDVAKANNYKGKISEDQLKQFLAWEKQALVKREVSKDILKVPEKKGEVFDLAGKKIQPDETIVGGKGYKVETEAEKKLELDKLLGPDDDVFGSPVKDWHMEKFKKPGAKDVTPKETEAQIKSRLEGMNKKTVERIRRRRYEAALKEERRKMAEDEFYIQKIIDPDDFAGGGIAGLGERTGYANGRWIDPGMSPGTSADYTPGQGHREDRKPYPYTPYSKDWPPSLRHRDLREEVLKKRKEKAFEAMWRGAPPGMGEREKMYRVQRGAKRLVDEKQEAFEKKIKEREKLYPYADMTEKEFATSHPKIYDYMKKDPAWDWETFQTVSFANPGETFQTTGASEYEGRGLPLGKTNTETLDLYMTPFGVTNYEMRAGPVVPDKPIMSDFKKAGVVLHELRHKKILKNPLLVEAQPPGAVDYAKWVETMKHGMGRMKEPQGKDYGPYTPTPGKELPVYRHPRPSGSKKEFSHPLDMHEVFNRFLDSQYGSWKTPSGPYFDKIWRDEWQPYAKEYERILKEKKPEPLGLAHGGRTGTGLNYLMGEDDQNMRVPLGLGGLNAARVPFAMGKRAFLKWLVGLGAGVGAAKTGLFSLLKGGGKKQLVETLTQVPIKDIKGMPYWYKPLVNKIIKEGNQIESGAERVIVHKSKLPGSKTDLYVTQELDTGHVMVDVGSGKHGFSSGHLGQPVRLEYRASEVIEPVINTQTKKVIHKGQKTKPEFNVEEAEFTGGHPENVKFEDVSVEKFGSHGSNFDEVEKFATGKIKKKTAKESLKAERAHWVPEGDDMASGGRVPLAGGSKPGRHSPSHWNSIIEAWDAYEGPMGFPEFYHHHINRAEGGRVPLGGGGISGSRVGMIFGGGIFKAIIKNLAKSKGVNPSYYLKVTNYKSLPNNAKKYISKVEYDKMREGRIAMFENLVEMAKSKQGYERSVKNLSDEFTKKGLKGDEFVDMMFKDQFKSPVPSGVTDAQILVGEQLLKNLKTKGRKLNASGGLANLLGE